MYLSLKQNLYALVEIVQPHNSGNVDVVFIPITEPNIVVGSRVQDLNGNIVNISQGKLKDVPLRDLLTIYGSLNNGEGILTLKNATLGDITGVYDNMGMARYPSERGDSGSPIIHHSNGTSKIVGVHSGGICIFESPSENVTLIDISMSRFCTTDQFYYKAFSAWENVKESLDLR